jgi:hypothetical protein
MKDEALKLALEALESVLDDSPKVLEASISGGLYEVVQCRDAITAIKQALALDKKAENARELGLDYEPVLKDNSNYRYDPPVAEPVAYLCENAVGHKYFRWKKPSSTYKPIALYTTPPAQPAPVQEPVAWMTPHGEGFRIRFSAPTSDVPLGWDALYTTPPAAQRQWVGLTDEEVINVMPDDDTPISLGEAFSKFAELIEAKLKEKNT